jgi:hypothetical protein
MTIDQIKVGDVLKKWHEKYTGSRPESEIIYFKVLAIGQKTVKVENEAGEWYYAKPNIFHGKAESHPWNNWA